MLSKFTSLSGINSLALRLEKNVQTEYSQPWENRSVA